MYSTNLDKILQIGRVSINAKSWDIDLAKFYMLHYRQVNKSHNLI